MAGEAKALRRGRGERLIELRWCDALAERIVLQALDHGSLRVGDGVDRAEVVKMQILDRVGSTARDHLRNRHAADLDGEDVRGGSADDSLFIKPSTHGERRAAVRACLEHALPVSVVGETDGAVAGSNLLRQIELGEIN